MKKFELGKIKVSTAASQVLADNNIDLNSLLQRHQAGDWGDIAEDQKLRNRWALEHGGLIFSNYALPGGGFLIIHTDIPRSKTWVMLEPEYQSKEIGIQEGYARWSSTYDQEQNPLIDAEEPYVDSILARLPRSVALDVGTGTGRYAMKLARRGDQVFAMDQSPEMLAIAQRHARRHNLEINFQLASLSALPFRSNHFGLLVCGLVLCHIPDLLQTMTEFWRVMRKDGTVLITDFHPGAVAAGWRTIATQAESWYLLPNSSHRRADYLESLAAASFKVHEVIDLTVGDIPDQTKPYFETWVHEQSDQLFGLIIVAQKVNGGT